MLSKTERKGRVLRGIYGVKKTNPNAALKTLIENWISEYTIPGK